MSIGLPGTLLAAAITVASVTPGQSGCFFPIEANRLDRLVKGVGFEGVPSISRNGPGTKLFLTGRAGQTGTLVKLVSEGAVVLKHFDSTPLAFDDDGEPLCWVTNHTGGTTSFIKALAFPNGIEIPIVLPKQKPARVKFSTDGKCFLLDQERSPTRMLTGWDKPLQTPAFLTPTATNLGSYLPNWVGVFRLDEPAKPLFCLPNDFYAADLFTRSNGILLFGFRYVFGTGRDSGRPPLENDKAWGLLFSSDDSGWKLTREIDLSKFGGVFDVDPVRGTLAVRSKRETFPEWGLLDADRGEYRSLGAAQARGLFLDAAFSAFLERTLK